MEQKLKLFPQDPDVILYETGFETDTLGRSAISKQLSDLVEKLEDPVVLALDDKWGAGKSYFLKRWVAAHTKENNGTATSVYFDAFENDYLSEPLVSLIAAISDRIPPKQEDTVTKLKTVGAKLTKPAFGIALSWLTFGAKQHLDEVGDAIADAVSGEAKDVVGDLWDAESARKDAIQGFKDLLEELTGGGQPPLVIVVDELDRCRPDYALSVLEVIKHFFAVPKVHFILGINGEALENSVKARYGADIDAERYLRKFINVSFSLPRIIDGQENVSTMVAYASKMSDEMGLPDRVSKRCVDLMARVAMAHDISLRDVGKILSKIALLPAVVSERNWLPGWIDILCVLLVSSVVAPKFHTNFLAGDATGEDILNFLRATELELTQQINNDYNSEYAHSVAIWVISMLYCCAPDELERMEFLPDWRNEVGKQFEQFGRPRAPTKIPTQIQRDWVEVFRI